VSRNGARKFSAMFRNMLPLNVILSHIYALHFFDTNYKIILPTTPWTYNCFLLFKFFRLKFLAQFRQVCSVPTHIILREMIIQYLVKSTNSEVRDYAIFSGFLYFHLDPNRSPHFNRHVSMH
jgi:hypothetical protein